jgi:RNA polymerase sigma-70 factor (ECF subfamily)
MSETDSFRDLIRRVRAGDPQATDELVRSYEPAICLAVHVRLTDPSLRRLFDSLDICQSVLGSFFLRAASGQFELDTPEQLVRLLTTMARNKLSSQVQKQRAARRDYRRLCKEGAGERDFVDPEPGPDRVVATQELLRELQSRLSEGARQLADRRALGRSWKEIAAELGEDPNTLRMRLARALNRIVGELGVEE